MTAAFFENPSFLAYVRHLAELHRLIAEDRDETPEGEHLRDEMDALADSMSAAEVDELNALSADFYELPRHSDAFFRNPTATVRKQMQAVLWHRKRQQYVEVFQLLRQLKPYVSSRDLAMQRGVTWREMGEPAIALYYFERVRLTAPGDDLAGFFFLRALADVNFPRALEIARSVAANPQKAMFAEAVAAADVLHRGAIQESGSECKKRLKEAAALLDELLSRKADAKPSAAFPGILVDTITLAALVHWELGETGRAFDLISSGLVARPMDEELLTLRGILHYAEDRSAARADFDAASIRRRAARSFNPWPAIYLAHDALLRNDFKACVTLAREGKDASYNAATRAKAIVLEAISSDYLGKSPDEVEALFDEANTLDPTDEFVRRNTEIFRTRHIGPTRPEWEWQRPEEFRHFAVRQFRVFETCDFPVAA